MDNLRKRLGQRIRDLRQARELTQEQLGERARVSYKFIGDVERGKGNPTVTWLDSVAKGLGVALKDLVADDAPRPVTYLPLSGRAYSTVREVRDSLETLLRRHNDLNDDSVPPASYRRPARSRTKRR